MRVSRFLVLLGALGLGYGVTSLSEGPHQQREAARIFTPQLGYEPGRLQEPSPRAYLTRLMTGIGAKPGERQWYSFNGLGGSLYFMHHLDAITPREAYESAPELFPWVGGKRYKPAGPSLNWQPDLGSPLVVAKAVENAEHYFQQRAAEREKAREARLGLSDAGFP